MSNEECVLVIDDADGRAGMLEERVRGLGFPLVRAKTPEQAFWAAPETRPPIGAVLLPPALAVVDLGAAIAALPGRLDGSRPGCVAVGHVPDSETLHRLREAGIQLALWDPFGDAMLRFQLNRALAGDRARSSRVETRVPTDLLAHAFAGGRRKDASVYTLSALGAFLETPRPSMPGALLSVELPLGPGGVRLDGRVVFTNVPGNLQKSNLPIGMGIAFTPTPGLVDQAIRRYVADASLALVI